MTQPAHANVGVSGLAIANTSRRRRRCRSEATAAPPSAKVERFSVDCAARAKAIVDGLLRAEAYVHSKTQEWIEAINDQLMGQLRAVYGDTNKLIVNTLILQVRRPPRTRTAHNCLLFSRRRCY